MLRAAFGCGRLAFIWWSGTKIFKPKRSLAHFIAIKSGQAENLHKRVGTIINLNFTAFYFLKSLLIMKKIKIVLPVLAFLFATITAFTTRPGAMHFTTNDGGAPGSCVSGTLDQTNCVTTNQSHGRCTINGGAENAFQSNNLTCQTPLYINN
jgi:hypothetical protein